MWKRLAERFDPDGTLKWEDQPHLKTHANNHSLGITIHAVKNLLKALDDGLEDACNTPAFIKEQLDLYNPRQKGYVPNNCIFRLSDHASVIMAESIKKNLMDAAWMCKCVMHIDPGVIGFIPHASYLSHIVNYYRNNEFFTYEPPTMEDKPRFFAMLFISKQLHHEVHWKWADSKNTFETNPCREVLERKK